MKTDAFILALSADTMPPPSLRRRIGGAMFVGASLSAVLFLLLLGPRPDMLSALHSWRFDLKFLDTFGLLIPAFGLCFWLSRPEVRPQVWRIGVVLPLLVLMLGVGIELASVPPALWEKRMIGHNARDCLTIIPLLALPPLVLLLTALRLGAPQNPSLTGMLAGLAATGVAATLYASHCVDDSPLFVATWYPLASLIVASLGAFLGRYWLRW